MGATAPVPGPAWNREPLHGPIPHTLKGLERYVRSWTEGLGLESEFRSGQHDLLDFLVVDLHLFLRERWLTRRPVRPLSSMLGPARRLLARSAPGLALLAEALRAGGSRPEPAGPHGVGEWVFLVQSTATSDLGTLLPVLSAATERGHPVRTIALDRRAAERLREMGVAVDAPFTRADTVWRHRARASRVLTALRRAQSSHGSARTDLQHLAALGAFEWLAVRAALAEALLERAAPLLSGASVLVTASDVHLAGKVFVTSARDAGIGSVLIQAGMMGESPDAVTIGFLPVTADTVCVWGEAPATLLRKHGVASARVRVTGQPRFDALARLRGEGDRAAIRAELGVGTASWLVTFASQNIFRNAGEVLELLGALVRAAAAQPSTEVIVKLHPAEDPTAWRAAERTLTRHPRVHVHPAGDLHRTLVASDAVVTAFSTAGLEALMLDRPLVILTDMERSGEMPYLDYGAAIPSTRAGLTEVLRELREEPALRIRLAKGAREMLGAYSAGFDGRATERVLDVLEEKGG